MGNILRGLRVRMNFEFRHVDSFLTPSYLQSFNVFNKKNTIFNDILIYSLELKNLESRHVVLHLRRDNFTVPLFSMRTNFVSFTLGLILYV